MEHLYDYLLFAAQATTILALFAAAIAVAVAGAQRIRAHAPVRLQISSVNDRLEATRMALARAMQPEREYKALVEERKKRIKARAQATEARRRVFVLDFNGDLRASAVASLREEISAALAVARAADEIVVRVESAGGTVHGYGLAASQLDRIRARGIRLTVAVDKVAASGGYMMACVADRIIAAPFAIVGSIGVVAQIPNVNRLLKKHDVDFELHTAGEHKRTLTVFGENSDAARAKFRDELEDAHRLFKEFIAGHRPAVDIAAVGTGEHWYGQRALGLNLVDELRTSDDYLHAAASGADVYELRWQRHRGWRERLLGTAARACGLQA
ncbi:MAG: protease SohB [Gammaproteobacteria bacterium]